MTRPETHRGWQDETARVQDERRPFVRRVRQRLQVGGMPLVTAFPSDQRVAAGIEACSYYTYPLLFYPYFPDISLDQLRDLSRCGSYLFDYTLCLDRLLDRSANGDVGSLLLSGALQREALSILYPLFPAGSRFWTYFDDYTDHFTQAVLRERASHQDLVSPYTEDDLRFIYSGKPAIAKAGIAALALLTSGERLIAPLTASHDAFYVAFQLLDDLQDWPIDYQRRHYSYPLAYAFLEAGCAREVESDRRPGLEEVASILEKTAVLEEVRSLVIRYTDRAEAALDDLPDSTWAAAIRSTRKRAGHLRLDGSSPVPAPADRPRRIEWNGSLAAAPAPIARQWAAWLDSRRSPAIHDPRIVDSQHRILRSAGGASSLGEALCQVGFAVRSSERDHGASGPAAHLGMSSGELEWCRRNDEWLLSLAAVHLEEPPELWTPDGAAMPTTGWVPPAVGRYVGYRLVESHSTVEDDLGSPDARRVAAVLDRFRRQLVA